MKIKIGDKVKINGSKTGRVFRVKGFGGYRARLIPIDPNDRRALLEPIENLRKV